MILLLRLLKNQRRLCLLTIALSIISICASLLWNAQLSVIINGINDRQVISLKKMLRSIFFIVFSAGTAYALSICSSWTLETIAHNLRMRYAGHFTKLLYPQIEHLSAGAQISKLQNEIDDVSVFLRTNLFSIVDDFIRFTASFCWMLWLNSSLTLLSSLPVVFLMCYTAFASKLIGKTTQTSQQANQEMTGFADTLLAVFPVIRLFSATAIINRQYGRRLENWETATNKEERRKALLMTISGMISSIPLLLLFLIGGTQVIKGTEDIGTLYIFLNLSGNLSGVMMNMAGRIAEFRRFIVNMNRLEPFTIAEVEEEK